MAENEFNLYQAKIIVAVTTTMIHLYLPDGRADESLLNTKKIIMVTLKYK